MEVRKVRIGNDICLNVRLIGDENSYINIRSIQAYLINTDTDKPKEEEQPNVVRYIGRFPIELGAPAYNSTDYDLCHCGNPTFHVRPIQNIVPIYAGFGVYPHTFDGIVTPFDPYYNHLWNVSKVVEKKKEQKDDKYQAKVFATKSPDTVKIYFPAYDQKDLGTYKLMIVAKIYEPGYGHNNLKTVTMDYDDVFTLVSTSNEADSNTNTEIKVGWNGQPVESVNILGSFNIGIGSINKFTAAVYPINAEDDRVSWELVGNNADSFAIVATTNNQCMVLAKPSEELGKTCKLRAESMSNPNAWKEVTISTYDMTTSDKYVMGVDYTGVDNNGVRQATFNYSTGDSFTVGEQDWYDYRS